MNKKEERERRNARLAAAVDEQAPQNHKQYPATPDDCIPPKKRAKTYEEIASIRKLEIPKCLSQPVNGRIYVIETAGTETKTEAGIIIERKLNIKKDDTALSAKRYFVVAWDDKEMPENILSLLSVGVEVNPFLPQEAENWSLPRVIDWQTGNEFLCVHYTELAGISMVRPEKAE